MLENVIIRAAVLGRGGSPADTNNYDRFDAPVALNTREV